MNQLMFHRVRTAIQVNANPGNEPEVAAIEGNLRETLMDSGLFEDVEVEHTDDPDQLVIGLCKFRPFYTQRDVAMRLEQIWKEQVGYPFWEAHAIDTDEDHVEFEAASRPSEDGGYVTVHLIAQKAHIPTQRASLA